MKNLLLVSLLLASTVFAAEKKVTTTTRTTVSPSYSDGRGARFGLGFATFGGGLISGTAHTASLMIELSELIALQPYFGIQSSSPFTFGGGAIFKYTLHGGSDNGFHTGIGFNLGTAVGGAGALAATSFYADIYPVLGMHFSLGGHVSNLKLSFDMGPIFHVTPTFQFQMTSISGIGGASLHYMF